MRPLRLRIEAFGSYAGAEEIDFDALGHLGLFLVTGPTGSGKTTIFDALVFALYGTVPGTRRAEEVHSHHAAPGSTPRVVLELEADGTRWRVERTAKHERPVRRGGGTTTEQPTAAMWRWQGGAWVAVASGLRDVNAAVVDRIGLTAEQFQRVVLLPQGDFEQFLVARTDDRKVLLRQLFGTEVYERAVEHLKKVASLARAACDDAAARHRQHVEGLVHHLEQAELLTGSLVFDDLPGERLGRLDRSLGEVDQARQRADSIAAGAERDLAAAQAVAARWEQRERRREERNRLAARRAEHDVARATLDAARRARPVRDLAAPYRRHQERASAAEATATARRAGLDAVLATLATPLDGGSADLATWRRELIDRHDRWRDWAERWRALELADRAVVAAVSAMEDRAAASERARAAAERAEAESEVAEQAWQAARVAVAGVDTVQQEAADAARDLARASELRRAEADLRAAHATACVADDAHRAAFTAYLRHAAPRLAAELRADEPCPVCGATDHPQPALLDPSAAAISVDQLDELRLAAGAAASRRDELAGEVGRRRKELGQLADLPVEVLAARAADAAARWADAERALVAATAAERELSRLRRVAQEARPLAADAAAAAAVAAAEADRCRLHRDEIAAELADVPAQSAVATELELLARAIELVDAVEAADHAATAARTAARVAAEALDAAVVDGGWADADAALAAALPDRELDRLDQAVDQWERAWHAIEAQLATDDAELPDDAPDLPALVAFAAETAAARAAAAERHAGLAVHVELARRAFEQLGALEAAAAEALGNAELAATVAERCAGQLAPKVSLESWVLGAELDRVVEAANAHLEEMTAGRYRLARTTDTTDARVSTGLDLVVDDAYTGTTRRTTSLSGGERFQASLALALGLADVVTAGTTATARTLDALFVDEGFGSLDAAALDQAISTLDRLRVHGRQIGVITHVEAMQSALPIGIRVERLPGEAGSRIVQPVTAA